MDSLYPTCSWCKEKACFHENVVDVWEDLNVPFSKADDIFLFLFFERKADHICISYLCSFINNLKQGSGSLLDYFIKIRSLWKKLNSHTLMPLIMVKPLTVRVLFHIPLILVMLINL